MRQKQKPYQQRTTRDEYFIEGYFGKQYGWEEVHADYDFVEIQDQLKAYQTNDPAHSYRWRKRRIKIERGNDERE